MWKRATILAVQALIFGAGANQPGRAAQSEPSQGTEPIKCEYVVSAEPGSKPTRMCLPQSQWAAKKKQDAADPTRIVCHYEEEPGTRFASRKICMSAAQWDDRKLQDRQDIERIQLQSSGRGP